MMKIIKMVQFVVLRSLRVHKTINATYILFAMCLVYNVNYGHVFVWTELKKLVPEEPEEPFSRDKFWFPFRDLEREKVKRETRRKQDRIDGINE